MEAGETEPLECDLLPAITVDAQTNEKQHQGTTVASATEALESDAYPPATDRQSAGSKTDGYWFTSIQTGHLESEPHARAAIAGDSQVVSNEQYHFIEGSKELHTCALASVSTVGLQAGESKHDETTLVTAGVVRPDAVDERAIGNELDDIAMGAAEMEAVGCAAAGFDVSVEECTTYVTLEAQNIHENPTGSILENIEVSVTSVECLEQEVVTVTQNRNTTSDYEGASISASLVGENEVEGTFEHIPIHNQEEIQGDEPVFDISEFDLGAHDGPITEAFFDEHCMFPALDADKAESWEGSEDNVILMESSGEHGSDQPTNVDAVPVVTSCDTIASHGSMEKSANRGKPVHETPLQTSFGYVLKDVAHVHAESSGANDFHVQGHEQAGGHQSSEADDERAEGLAPVPVNGNILSPENVEGSDAQEMYRQGDAEGIYVSYVEKNTEIAQLENNGPEYVQNTDNHAEEVENEDKQLNESHSDAAVDSVKFENTSPDSCTGAGLESNTSILASNEEELLLSAQATLISPPIETLKSHEEGMKQAFRNEEKQDTSLASRVETLEDQDTSLTSRVETLENQDTSLTSTAETLESYKESVMQAFVNEKNECADSQLNENSQMKEKNAFREPVEGEKDAFTNEGDSSNFLEAACAAGSAEEALFALANSKQEEEILADIHTSEISREAVLLVEEPLVREELESTPEKVLLNDKSNKQEEEIPVSAGVQTSGASREAVLLAEEPLVQEEVGRSNKESTLEKAGLDDIIMQFDPPVPHMELNKLHTEEVEKQMDDIQKCAQASDAKVVNSRESDVGETVEDRGIVGDKVEGLKTVFEEVNEQAESCSKPPVDLEKTVRDRGEVVEEKVVLAEQENEKLNEQKESEEPPLAKVVDSRESDVGETVEDRGEVGDKLEGLKTEFEEVNEQAESCSKPPVDLEETVKDRGEVVEEKLVLAVQENEKLNEEKESEERPSAKVVDSRDSDVGETVEDRGVVGDTVEGLKTEFEEVNEHEESCSKPPVDLEETVKDRGEVVEEKVVLAEQENEKLNEWKERPSVDTPLSQGHIVEEATGDLTADRVNKISPLDVKTVEGSDGNMLDRRQKDEEEVMEDRGEIVEDKVAGFKQQRDINEQEKFALQSPGDIQPLPVGIAEDSILMAERTNTGSSSDVETATSFCSDLTLMNVIPEGPKKVEKHALQSLESVGEDSKEKRDVGSPSEADSLSKKQLQEHISYSKSHKSSVQKGGSNLDNSNVQAKEGDHDDSDDGESSEPEDEMYPGKVHKDPKEGTTFGIGDLVWAKVRSHPWWPAQIFDPADASKSARKAKKFGRVLVAFFGDCTFAWLQQSQMIAFRPHFNEKVKQTTVRIFCIAVEEALQEFCRRSELGLSCAHFKGSLHSTCSFPDANTGIREGVRVKRHKDFGSSVHMFRPHKTLEYVKRVACSPLGQWCSTLKFAEFRGHVYGLRTCMVASGTFDSDPVLSTIDTVSSHGSQLKRTHSSLENNDDADGGGITKLAKKMKNKAASDEKGFPQISKKPRKTIAGGQGSEVESMVVGAKERNKDSFTIKFKVSKKLRGDGIPDQAVDNAKSSDNGKETLLTLVGSSHKAPKQSSSNEDKEISSHKEEHIRTVRKSKKQINSASPDSEAAAFLRIEADAEDAFVVTSSLSEVKVSKADVKRSTDKKKASRAAWSSASSIDVDDLQERTHRSKRSRSPKVHSGDETEKPILSKFSKEVENKKEGLGIDIEAGKKETARKFSRVGDSIRKVAGELTGTVIGKSFDNSSVKSPGRPTIKLKLPASLTPKKALSKESAEDVDLLQLRQDLDLLANKSGGGSRKAGKHVKKGNQVETVAGKASPQWHNVPHKTQKSCVQELALAARKRKSEIVQDEVSAKLPKDRSTTGPQGHHASKAYMKGVEKPTELRSGGKSVSYYSRKPALPASNVKGGSSQRYDEKLSSHMPLGLFMRFPEDFPLPSESQLKAAFIPFGPLQMSATRLYHDSASAQVVFKHGRDAESAMRHAKKNPVFGPVAVTYRLRHLSQSLKMESKSDPSSPNDMDTPTPVRMSYVAKEKGGGSSAAVATRAGDKELGTSGLLTSINSGSESTGDIQDQMMNLLRQVSVLVKPSPVGSDGT